MKKLFLLFLSVILLSCSKSDGQIPLLEQKDLTNERNAAIVQRQLDAYNARNLSEFLEVYSEDCVITEHKTKDTLMKGKAAMRERYGQMFSTLTNLQCSVPKRITIADYVIDEEVVNGLRDSGTVHAVAVYEIKNDSIISVHFIR